ncbi:hypothetical protein A3C59_04270 [Candidatus Daviesbacteria bacterium RIFCSPHIGHO2_02_FULL_36_13]|uniref:TIGR00374 family protein n=1 Tax=Candidatus Daviesbacteria bacterium RIFCSPHIGHO2_02_FULL_36_13 TaxID=1797768 RepID=A0A1F5JRS5_9BACT|nr:MAG: hypothetical protein A3C59_04270 [Candidatus Daviesbacteria bacterium RIFCSPHIGHO2_02_FULL_36_13]
MVKIIFNALLGLLLIFIWSRFVNIEEIFHTISKVNPLSLIPIFFFLLLSPIIRSIRLKIFLSEIKKISLKDLIMLNGAALMLNFLIPIRAGEIAKGVYLSQKYGLNLGKAVIWVFIDRFVDFLVVLLLASLFVSLLPTQLPSGFSKTALVIFILALLGTYLVVFQINLSRKIASFLPFKKLSHFMLDSFTILDRHPRDLFLMILTTLLAYLADAFILYYGFKAVGYNEDILRMYFAQLLTALTYLIPAAPGFVGSAEASGLLVFSGIFGIDPNISSSVVVLLHISTILFVLVFGIIGVLNLKLDLGLILRKALKRR